MNKMFYMFLFVAFLSISENKISAKLIDNKSLLVSSGIGRSTNDVTDYKVDSFENSTNGLDNLKECNFTEYSFCEKSCAFLNNSTVSKCKKNQGKPLCNCNYFNKQNNYSENNSKCTPLFIRNCVKQCTAPNYVCDSICENNYSCRCVNCRIALL